MTAVITLAKQPYGATPFREAMVRVRFSGPEDRLSPAFEAYERLIVKLTDGDWDLVNFSYQPNENDGHEFVVSLPARLVGRLLRTAVQ